MNRLDIQEQPPIPEGSREFYLLNYDRTVFDYIIIATAYVFMPFAFVLALLRMLGTHYKNQRKATNYNLWFHVFVGAFVELAVISVATDSFDLTSLIFFLIFLALIFLLPAFFVGNAAAKAKYKFSRLCHSYIGLILDNKVVHIGSLSERTGQSESDVRRDVFYLKERGLLPPDTTFSEGRQAEGVSAAPPNPVSPSGFGSAERTRVSRQQVQAPPELPKAVRCPGCGAQNTVQPGQAKACDYCGTTLSYS